MNILAIDYGAKRMGLAWTDTAMGVVLPYGVIENSKSEIRNSSPPQRDPATAGKQTSNSKLKTLVKLCELIKTERIEKVVMGLPIGLDGKENENTKNVRTFAAELEKEISTPIDFIDERFTSAEADRMLGGEASRDEKAAMVILQAYIDKQVSK